MNSFISKLKKPNLMKRVWKHIRSFFYLEQWILLLAQDVSKELPSWDEFTRIIPPLDRIWADPFIWIFEDKYYIFFEEKSLDTKRGRICCLTLDDDLDIIATTTVLERPYHLSYPFLFEYKSQLYMLPETGENHSVEVYRCVQFPDKWELAKTLMSGVRAVDATLLEAEGKWWLFVNIAGDGGSTWDTLHLFYANHPLSDDWVPHSSNPIVKDIRSARPAGKIYYDGRNFIRPSQDCSVRYGYAVNFNRILNLSESEYKEALEQKFLPSQKGILGTHTWNELGNLRVMDAKILRRKF